MDKIRVMIVEDSRTISAFLTEVIGRDPRLEVVAIAESGEEAVEKVPRIKPDVISMDIRLPGMNGFDATRRIMAELPTPIVVVSASVNDEDMRISMNAIEAGALAVVEKPVGESHDDYVHLAERLCTQLAIMSQVKVIRQRFRREGGQTTTNTASPASSAPGHTQQRRIEIVGLVASTGGPKALQTILSALPADFQKPIAIVQHITNSFHEGFVNWLNDICPLGVSVPATGDRIVSGNIYVAPADRHLHIKGGSALLSNDPPVCAQRPSGTVLFRSLALNYGSSALGVLLTGMGDDGADGLKALHDAGGFTIAEHESTAVVNGMPGAAVRLGAAHEVLPLHKINARLVSLVRKRLGVDA